MTFLPDLPLVFIDIPADRARDFDLVWAEGLATIIAQQGLTNAITVRQIGARYLLVTGLHRLMAVKILGLETIPARVSAASSDNDARLEEVMENLGRKDLIPLDRCHHLYELKQAWERKYPQAAHGKASPKSRNPALCLDETPVMGFARATADKIGLGPTQIKLAVKIWSDLSPASRKDLVGTDLACKQTELKALSEQTPLMQAKILTVILSPDHEAGNVAQALDYLAKGIVPTSTEKRFLTVSRTFGALDDLTFDNVIAAHEDRVIASLQRRGRI